MRKSSSETSGVWKAASSASAALRWLKIRDAVSRGHWRAFLVSREDAEELGTSPSAADPNLDCSRCPSSFLLGACVHRLSVVRSLHPGDRTRETRFSAAPRLRTSARSHLPSGIFRPNDGSLRSARFPSSDRDETERVLEAPRRVPQNSRNPKTRSAGMHPGASRRSALCRAAESLWIGDRRDGGRALPLVHDAVLHHEDRVVHRGNAGEGIAGDRNDVGELVALERADSILPA